MSDDIFNISFDEIVKQSEEAEAVIQEKCNQILSKTTFHNIEIRDIWAYVTVLRNEMDQLEQQIAKQKQAGVDPVQPIRDIDHQRTELMTKIIRQVCDLIGYLRKEIRAYQEEIRILKQNPSCYLEKNGLMLESIYLL